MQSMNDYSKADNFNVYDEDNNLDSYGRKSMNERYPHFSRSELASPDTGDHWMDPEFMELVELLRTDYWGQPMILSSAYRTPDYNDKRSTTGRNGPHTTGKAIDVLISGADAYRFLMAVMALNEDMFNEAMSKGGFTGIGISQRGPHKSRFIHLDSLTDDETEGPRPWIWSY
jgi:uncharacterized protein YcbK (DUF882 family)